MAKKKKPESTRWLKKYTFTFIVVYLIVYSLQIYYKKSFVYSEESLCGDGLIEAFNALAYYGSWLRSILKNIFVNNSFSIPEYDLSIGMGGDIVTTLNYYVLGDPLNLLAVLIPPCYTEFLYNALVVIRLYLSGITFYIYCLYNSYEAERILPGVIIYVFSFYSITTSVLHPYFLNPLIYFPLILLGVDKILRERKSILFILSCALAAISQFYFFYMMTILMSIYGIIRYIQYNFDRFAIMDLIKEIAKFALYYIIALMIAAPIFGPSIAAILNSERIGETAVPPVYELIYYIKLPIAFMNASADYYVHLGYGAVGALAVVLLFAHTKWKEKATFKVLLILETIFLLFPFFGHMFNGFGYVTNRWIWAYCFLISLIVVEMFPDIKKLPPVVIWGGAGVTVLAAVPTFYFRMEGNEEKFLANIVFLFIFICVFVILLLVCRKVKKEAELMAYIVIIVMNSFLSMFGFYSPISGNDISRHGNLGSAYQDLMSGPFSVLEGLDKENFGKVRIDTSNLYFNNVRANSAMQYDVNSIAFYYQVINPNTNNFLHELWIPKSWEGRNVDLDSRAALMSLSGVKYDIIKTGEEEYLPYGYDFLVQEKNGYALYETNYALPLVYMYDSFMKKEEYDMLSPAKKEMALMQTAIVDGADLNLTNLRETSVEKLNFEDTVSDYIITDADGVELLENKFCVTKENAFILLKTNNVDSVERSFGFEDLWYEGEKNALITITDGIISKSFEVKSDLDPQYVNIHNFLCNLGYSEHHGDSYQIIFNRPGVYTFDSIKIHNQSVKNMKNWVEERKASNIEHSFGEDSILIHADAKGEGILYLSIPYSIGWKASVNGKSADILKINDFGMGLCVGSGEQVVEFRYYAPYTRLGIVLMLIGIIASAKFSRTVSFREHSEYEKR